MSIEDVDLMKTNSENESIQVLIDSSNRNKTFYESPSNYTIVFSRPIRNVFGFEIMDAAIPVTMWSVDIHNDVFAFSQVIQNNEQFELYFNELQFNDAFEQVFNGRFSSHIFIFENRLKYNEIFNEVKIVKHSHNIMFLRQLYDKDTHSIKKTVIPDFEKQNPDLYIFEHQSTYFKVNTTDKILDVIKHKWYIINTDLSIVCYDWVYIDEASISRIQSFDVYLSNTVLNLEKGNYDSMEFMQYIASELKLISQMRSIPIPPFLPFKSSRYGSMIKQQRITWTCTSDNAFFFDMQKSTCGELLGFTSFARENVVSTNNKQNPMYHKLKHHKNDYLFMSTKLYDNTTSLYHHLETPGVLNFQSIKYVHLRIPELEQHMNSGFSHEKHYPGVALFKMANGMDISHLRFDYVNLIKKPFHPIGKLTKLTFRFETKDGKLYDFKGVDHYFLAMINFYAPKSVVRVPRSILNPNYNPDILEYLYPLSEEEDQEIEPEILRKLLLEEKQYTYSSDSDD